MRRAPLLQRLLAGLLATGAACSAPAAPAGAPARASVAATEAATDVAAEARRARHAATARGDCAMVHRPAYLDRHAARVLRPDSLHRYTMRIIPTYACGAGREAPPRPEGIPAARALDAWRPAPERAGARP